MAALCDLGDPGCMVISSLVLLFVYLLAGEHDT